MITIIVTYRDRNIDLAKRFLDSLAWQTDKRFTLLLIDYGSSAFYAREIKDLVSNYTFANLIRSDTRGHIWNKSIALNIGIRNANTDFIMTTDIDIIFSRNFIKVVNSQLRPGYSMHCFPIHLPEKFSNWQTLEHHQQNQFGNKRMLGACLVVEKQTVKSIRGFDENYFIWGKEDLDMKWRLDNQGVKAIWLNELTTIWHQWHERKTAFSSVQYYPSSLWGDYQLYIQSNRKKSVRNGRNWGKIVRTSDRTILTHVDMLRSGIKHEGHLKHFDRLPTTNRALADFVDEFLKLEMGQVVAVHNASHPKRTLLADIAIGLSSFFAKDDSRLQYQPNLLHDFISTLIIKNRELFLDYYLETGDNNDITLLQKGSPNL